MFVFLRYLLAIFCLSAAAVAEEDANLAALDQQQLEHEFLKQKGAAAKGDLQAQYSVGFMYLQGEGVQQDQGLAFKWIHLAARSGLADAQDTLAYLYRKGVGIKADRVRAYVWYSVAAANGAFLASRVMDSMAKELSATEHVQARVMLKEYLQLYLSNN